VLGFGADAPAHADPRYLRVALQPHGAIPFEHWRAHGPATHGRDGDVAWADDGALLFGAIELDEGDVDPTRRASDIETTADRLYRRLGQFLQEHGTPHLLRVWNYLDGITVGEGDLERYRQFCVGRARGLGEVDPHTLPAATAIGQVNPEGAPRRLQVYWLASRVPGTPLENPRQISAYRYPRQYGPQPPSFARAMLPPAGSAMPLMLSGTAAIVGHESQHADSVATQLDETLANFDSLIQAARAQWPSLPARFGAHSPLKVYVRDRDELEIVARALDERLPREVPRVVLHAAVCRRELRVEIDGVHG
jgi:chorismate lyase/3-hydroxybenzoate synthase